MKGMLRQSEEGEAGYGAGRMGAGAGYYICCRINNVEWVVPATGMVRSAGSFSALAVWCITEARNT